MGEGTPKELDNADQALWDTGSFVCRTQFREVEREEPMFWAIWEAEIARRDLQVIWSELCEQLHQFEVRRGLLY